MDHCFSELLWILKNEIKPSLGCSGPVGVSYAAAEARDAVGGTPAKIKVIIDKDMCAKNCDVGIPGTSALGIPMAAAMGAFGGNPGKKLNVLEDMTKAQEAQAYEFSLTDQIQVIPDWETTTIGVYTEVFVETENGTGHAIVAKTHSNLVYKAANGKVIIDKGHDRLGVLDEKTDAISSYDIETIYDFSLKVPIEEIAFLKEAVTLNKELAFTALNNKDIGAGFGFSMFSRKERTAEIKAKAYTAAASEARMHGVNLPAMSCATSGNAGISVSMPLMSLAEDLGLNDEKLLRALALGYLATIKTKNSIGRHSAMCACVVAASLGVAAGTVLLLNGGYRQVDKAINNVAVNVFGVVCDGARLACALKLSSAAHLAIESGYLAMDDVAVMPNQGVCGESADETINFMGSFAREGMMETDLMLCKALYDKNQN